MRRVRRGADVRGLLQDRRGSRRRWCRRRWRIDALLGQSLVRLHNLRDGEGEVSTRRRGSHPLGRQTRRRLGRHCAARCEWLHGRSAMKIPTSDTMLSEDFGISVFDDELRGQERTRQ